MITSIERVLFAGPQLLWVLNVAVGALAAAVLGLAAAWLFRRRAAPLRYGLLLMALLVSIAAPGGAWLAQWARLGWFQVNAEHPLPATMAPADAMEPGPSVPLAAAAGSADVASVADTPALAAAWPEIAWWQALGSLLAVTWAAGIIVGIVRIAWGWAWVVRLRATFVAAADPRVLRAAHQAAGLLQMRRPPAVFISPALPVPLVVGPFRPILVLPVGLADRLTRAQLQAVMLHETAHIAHGDLWVGLLQRLAAVMFWWCPPLHRLNRRLSDLREDICDNYVLQTQGDGLGFAQVLVDLAAAVKRAAQPRLIGAIGILDSARGGLEGRIARLLQKECNTMTRMNRTALTAAALFGLGVCTMMLVVNVRAADKEPAKSPTVEELLGAKDFWLTTGASAKHDFDEKQIAEIRELAQKSPQAAIRMRANKLVCDLDGKWQVAKQLPAELAGKVVGATFAHLESSLGDATVAKFAPENGFTHYSATARNDKDEPDSIWVLVESVGPNMPNGGLNLRWNIKTGKIDRIDHWGAERAKGKDWLNRLPFLGEGREAVVTHCGQPAKEVTLASGIESLHFQADGFRSIVEISPKTKKAIQVYYFKKTPFTKTEIEELLARNTEGHTWKQDDRADSDRARQRSDGGSSRGGELRFADGKANESSFIVLSGPALREGQPAEKQGSNAAPQHGQPIISAEVVSGSDSPAPQSAAPVVASTHFPNAETLLERVAAEIEVRRAKIRLEMVDVTGERLTQLQRELARVEVNAAEQKFRFVAAQGAAAAASDRDVQAAEAEVQRAKIRFEMIGAEGEKLTQLKRELARIDVHEAEQKLRSSAKRQSQGLASKAEVEAAHNAMNQATQQLTDARDQAAAGGKTRSLPRVAVRIINTTSEAEVVGEAGAADAWIAKQITRPTNTEKDAPTRALAVTPWHDVGEVEAEIYQSMQGGRLIKARLIRKEGQVTVRLDGRAIGKAPHEITLPDKAGERTVVKLTDYPGERNLYAAVSINTTQASTPSR